MKTFTLRFGVLAFAIAAIAVFSSFNKSTDPSDKGTTEKEIVAEKKAGESSQIEWLTFEEAIKRQQEEPRKIMVDLYTDWCGWCKRMDASTFGNEMIGEYLNEKWYAVKFDAEQKEAVMYKDEAHNFVASGRRGYNELAHRLTKGRLSYPTIVYLDENADIIQAIPGFKDAKAQDKILKFFGENHFRDQTWADFQMEYKSPITATN